MTRLPQQQQQQPQPPHARTWRRAAAAACFFTLGAQAQQSSDSHIPAATVRQQASEIAGADPARWHQEDTTDAARLRTLKKEMGAALQEAQGACRALAAAQRAACGKEARAIYQQDMANLRKPLNAR